MAATFDQPPSAAPRRRATPARRASHDPFATKGMHTAAQFAIVTNRARSQYRYDVRPPQQLIDSERKEMLHYILDDQFQHLRVLLLSSRGLSYMDINERLPRGQHEGLTLLHLAVIHASAGTVNTLLQLASANPNVKAEKGEHIPSYWRGATPLHLAAEKGYLKTLKFLIGAGAKVDMTDEQLRTPLMSAICHATSRMGHELCARELVRRGADLNARDFMGDGPFHLACDRGEVAMLLLKVGIARGAYDVHGMTPLHLAVDKNDVKMYFLLLKSGSHRISPKELSLRNDLGWAVLHTAAFRGFEVAARMLLEANAVVDELTADGWTALQLASSQGHARTAAVLIKAGADTAYDEMKT
ncbi:hypothetical protein AB1Y20_003334 [Prymnesium parvum]|uniref:Uncharacterized protein n=1 Tax=Prymnesium parvum TaxID=97485 RepID=A0AB34JE99_PRYPA